ncbi:transcriptional regulator, HxlR family [Pustulibacterium marinum]|uniref:Transcriptional regulator, HxlR family n=1 Tax=Pustulibacterium marinum TaxID=1224947 RepID=A0A1I7IMR5_9FLAO|nr:helix-turn-helix domain-containing protein [Pustulibacterium marinum]SFU74207.1 transcriptional regulator, HxlR family [Pustulibacterium marinum]
MKPEECKEETVMFKGISFPCTVSLAMSLIGGKWKAVILYHLMNGSKRYHELRTEMPTVTEMTLSIQLKQLAEDGLIKRKVNGSKPPLKVTYSLTALGKTVIPVLNNLTDWGNYLARISPSPK